MNKLLTLVFVLSFTIVSAQKAKFSFFAGVNYGILNAKDTYSEEFTFFQSAPQVFTVNKLNLTWSHTSEMEPGFKAGLNIHFPLKNNLNLRTGIEAQYVTFVLTSRIVRSVIDEEFGSIETEDVSEFVFANIPDNNIETNNFCPDNSFNFTFAPVLPVAQYLYYGKIPLGLEASFFEGDITIYSGLFFSTIIKREIGVNCRSIDFQSSFFSDTVDFTKTNHSTNINSSTFGGDFGFSYQLVEKISLEGNFSTTFNSIFARDKDQFDTNTGVGIPATLQVASLGARISLN